MRFPTDIINHFAGIEPGSPLDALRDQRPEAKDHAGKAFAALFTPENPGGVTLEERFALGVFTAALHGADDLAAMYAEGLKDAGAPEKHLRAILQAASSNAGTGPYGCYPVGPLSAEDVPGPLFAAGGELAAALGSRLTAALRHTHMLVLHPRDADAASVQALFDAGWSEDDAVTISQLATFLAYQVRLIHGLRVLGRHAKEAQQ